MRIRNKKLKIRYMLLLLLMALLLTPFVMWMLSSGRTLDIVVMNKTFPLKTSSSGEVTELDYSKQRGLFWVINYLGIKNPGKNKAYDGTTDYSGNQLVNGRLVSKPLERAAKVPDLIYISDMYGTGNSKVNGTEPAGVSGMTKEEVGFVSTSYAKGSTVIGEYNIAGDPTKESVSKELESIFELHFTGLAGKFFSNLASKDDVPGWIRATYEQQYGKKWDLEGAGIIIAGDNRIVVLQRDVDFTGKSLQISMSGSNANAYHTTTVDYYNWFEIVEPADPQSVIAWYDLNVSEKGADQLKLFGLDHRFPAIIANQTDQKHAYYLAGDFTDYRGPDKIKTFAGAAKLYRYFSVNSEGDLSYFYWQFYVPFMTKVLKDVEPIAETEAIQPSTETAPDGTQLVSKVMDKQFAVYKQAAWNKVYVKGVDIGPTIPGGTLPDDPAFYQDWFEQIADMNANTVRVYTLMPPAFYRALDVYNYNHPDHPLYMLQSVSVAKFPPGDIAAVKQTVVDTVDAMHGRAAIQSGDNEEAVVYQNDVSPYVLGYMVDPGLNATQVAALNQGSATTSYQGEYVSAGEGATRTEAWLASVMDELYRVEQTSYNMQHPVGLVSTPALDSVYHAMFDPVGTKAGATIDLNHIEAETKVKSGLFGAYDIPYEQQGLIDGGTGSSRLTFDGFSDYLNAVMTDQRKYPALISGFGVPSSNGLTEADQGEGIASMLKIVKDSGAMGGLVYEWADEWAAGSSSIGSNRWHDLADRAQNYGIIAMESRVPTEYAMTLRGQKPLNTFAMTADESYLYLKAEFSELPDFKNNSLHIFLDTVDRKNGEYMVAPDVVENWSGVEFEIKLPDRDHADLLVIPEYNVSEDSYSSSVSTAGIFERMVKKLSPAYVAKSGRTVPAKYEDVSVLTEGAFDHSENRFYFNDKTLNIRIPWALLNFTDPSSLLVVNGAEKDAIQARMTDGIVPSLIMLNKQTNQVVYHFPESVKSSGYRTFLWNTWEVPRYEQRVKLSYDRLKEAFKE